MAALLAVISRIFIELFQILGQLNPTTIGGYCPYTLTLPSTIRICQRKDWIAHLESNTSLRASYHLCKYGSDDADSEQERCVRPDCRAFSLADVPWCFHALPSGGPCSAGGAVQHLRQPSPYPQLHPTINSSTPTLLILAPVPQRSDAT